MNIVTIILASVALLATTAALGQSKSKKLQTFEVQDTIAANIDSVWSIMVENFGDPAAYTPNLYHSHSLTDTTEIREGSQRFCALNEKGSKFLKEEIEFMDKENYYFRVKINEISQPLNTDLSRVNIYLIELSPNSTIVRIQMSYRTKPAFVGGLAKGKFKSIFKDLLIGLNHYAQTGERVNASIGNFKKIKSN